MIDLGKKQDTIGSPCNPKRSKAYVSYPEMTIEQKQMPFLKGMDMDDEFIITVKCKVKSKNKYNDGDIMIGISLLAAEKGKEKSNE